MNCSETNEHLSAYQDGELDSDLASQLRTHLRDCPGCRLKLHDLDSTWELLAASPSLPPQPEFLPKLRERIGALAQPSQLSSQRKVWALGAAAAMLLLAFGLFGLLSSPDMPISTDLSPVLLPIADTEEALEAALLREALSDPDILEILTDLDVLDAGGPSLLGDMEFLNTVEASSPSPDEISSEEAALLFILDDSPGDE